MAFLRLETHMFKTTIILEVLSEESITEMDLSDILEE